MNTDTPKTMIQKIEAILASLNNRKLSAEELQRLVGTKPASEVRTKINKPWYRKNERW